MAPSPIVACAIIAETALPPAPLKVRQQQQAHSQGMGILGNLLDADGDGNMMDDILGMAMKQMMK